MQPGSTAPGAVGQTSVCPVGCGSAVQRDLDGGAVGHDETELCDGSDGSATGAAGLGRSCWVPVPQVEAGCATGGPQEMQQQHQQQDQEQQQQQQQQQDQEQQLGPPPQQQQ